MGAETLHCQSCGAAVGERDIRCPYCGGQLATVACPKCFALVSITANHCPRCGAAVQRSTATPAETTCPDCRTPLAATTLGDLAFGQCHRCGGVWVGQAAFEHMAGDRAERAGVLSGLPTASPKVPIKLEQIHYRPCPQCGKLMNRSNYARISGIVVDVCKDHGIWFDRDELRQTLEFIEANGLEKSRAREQQDKADQARTAAIGTYEPPASASEANDDELPIFESLSTVLRALFRLFT